MFDSSSRRLRLATLIGLAAISAAGTGWAEEQTATPDDTYTVFVGVAFADKSIVGDDKQAFPNPLFGLRWDHYSCSDRSIFVDGAFTLYNGGAARGHRAVAVHHRESSVLRALPVPCLAGRDPGSGADT